MEILINTDGGARGNPGPAASAFVATDTSGNLHQKRGKYLGVATNNFAEYQGVVLALEWVKELVGERIDKIQFFLDSNLVVNQLNGNFKVKEGSLQKLFALVKQLEREVGVPISYSFVRRERNVEADKLVNETLDKQK